MPVTIKQVAEKCGLPAHIVGRVLFDYASFGPEAHEKVLAAARELGYPLDQLPERRRSQNLGVLFVDETYSGLTHPFFASMLNAFKAEVEDIVRDYLYIQFQYFAVKLPKWTIFEKIGKNYPVQGFVPIEGWRRLLPIPWVWHFILSLRYRHCATFGAGAPK